MHTETERKEDKKSKRKKDESMEEIKRLYKLRNKLLRKDLSDERERIEPAVIRKLIRF